MAKLVNKLHVQSGNQTYECTSYTTPEEATPKGGSCWQIKNNGTTAYLPLSLATGSNGFRTIKISDPYFDSMTVGFTYNGESFVTDYLFPPCSATELRETLADHSSWLFQTLSHIFLNNGEPTEPTIWDIDSLEVRFGPREAMRPIFATEYLHPQYPANMNPYTLPSIVGSIVLSQVSDGPAQGYWFISDIIDISNSHYQPIYGSDIKDTATLPYPFTVLPRVSVSPYATPFHIMQAGQEYAVDTLVPRAE